MKGPTQKVIAGKTSRKPRGDMPRNAVSKHAKARQQRQQAKQRR